MLRELIHLARHAPGVLALQRRLEQVDLYDVLMERADAAGFAPHRSAIVSDLRGDVLEIGCGTGLMFPYYAPEARVVAIDTDERFLERARTRAPDNVSIQVGDATALPLAPASFDAVVSCLVFCSVPDPEKALAEIRRVLRPGGQLRMLEHVVSERPAAGAMMRAFDPVWLWLNDQGCHMHRDTVQTVRGAFPDVQVEHFQIFSAGLPAFPMREIRAHA